MRFEVAPQETDLFFGIDHSRLFLALQHKLLSVLKAILLEAKVLVAASAVRNLVYECSPWDQPKHCGQDILLNDHDFVQK